VKGEGGGGCSAEQNRIACQEPYNLLKEASSRLNAPWVVWQTQYLNEAALLCGSPSIATKTSSLKADHLESPFPLKGGGTAVRALLRRPANLGPGLRGDAGCGSHAAAVALDPRRWPLLLQLGPLGRLLLGNGMDKIGRWCLTKSHQSVLKIACLNERVLYLTRSMPLDWMKGTQQY
jgi:hypothetical protein